MKKLLFLFSFFCLIGATVQAQSTTPAFSTTANSAILSPSLAYRFQVIPTGEDTIKVLPGAYETIIKPQAAMTSNLLVYIPTVKKASLGDKIYCTFLADGTARVVTFGGSSTTTAGTVTAAINKRATLTLMFDGTRFVEIARFVQP